MSRYVESGYVESGYVDGDVDFDSIKTKKVHFVVDNQGLSSSSIQNILEKKIGESYKDNITVILGDSLKVAEKINDEFEVKEIAGRLKEADIDKIASRIPTTEETADSLLQMEDFIFSIARTIASERSFIDNVADLILGRLNVRIVAKNGDELASSLVYDSDTNSYKLDYDTSLLDGTDYEIIINIL